jgi:hypothetical protein
VRVANYDGVQNKGPSAEEASLFKVILNQRSAPGSPPGSLCFAERALRASCHHQAATA